MLKSTRAITLENTTYERLEQLAQMLERSPEWLVEQAISAYLKQLESIGQIVDFPKQSNSASAQQEDRQPFQELAAGILPQSVLRTAITSIYRSPEPELLPALLEQARLPKVRAIAVHGLARSLTEQLRKRKPSSGRAGLVQGMLQEFSLSSDEGIALMCLAEALLRIPDKATRDALIRDKIGTGNWQHHLGQSNSLFVNAATWGLRLSGKLITKPKESSLASSLNRIIGEGGQPLIRKGIDMAIHMLGEQFVSGETIAQALASTSTSEEKGFRHSYDMLGEAALTAQDAKGYLTSYEQAIHAIGKAANGRGIYEGPGISIKLSALHPRYSRAQYQRVMEELYPALLSLVLLARQYEIGLNIDAEESERLELSLDLLERLCFEPKLADWNGIGFVVQAYQKRCPLVIDYLIDLARRSHRRLMIRLVKGAYWDSEIKRAQVDGLANYPVFTRKAYTDVSYLACARRLLAAPDAVYPQFATHNAHTVAAIYHLAGRKNYQAGQYEFQCLYGMGEPLYELVVGNGVNRLDRPCRIYAPVGNHGTLLAYLVRRLLENGANSSFVNRVADHSVSLDDLVADPVALIERMGTWESAIGLPHPRIPLPPKLYGEMRSNSRGLDLSNEHDLGALACALRDSAGKTRTAEPLLGCEQVTADEPKALLNPADHREVIGKVCEASRQDVDNALACAVSSGPAWQALPATERAAMLERAADLMEARAAPLIELLVREAGKTLASAIGEVREATDFLRYYAAQVRDSFDNHTHCALGPVVCISPWNFPLAIFTGQVAAALATGNTVLAKPAEQTPLIAAQAVRLLHEAGISKGALQLLPGQGENIGARLVADERIRGVLFTGSIEVARLIQRSIADRLDEQGRSIPLIAETGGLNAMIVDSSALPEQVVQDVIASAFDSAGQRCSALRILCVQDDIADQIISMLGGALAEYRLGNPQRLQVDIGPVIDTDARDNIEQYIQAMRDKGHKVSRLALADGDECTQGSFVIPALIELESFDEVRREIFGPVLHLVRYPRDGLEGLLEQINASDYGLTMGVHSRIDTTIACLIKHAAVGNLYVNRSMIGATVGVQPFGGAGLSGTGPKAGGPLYLYRLLSARPQNALTQAFRLINADESAIQVHESTPSVKALQTFQEWFSKRNPTAAKLSTQYAEHFPGITTRLLTGPTGESNSYSLLPRRHVLCLAQGLNDLLIQLAAVLVAGGQALWVESDAQRDLYRSLPLEVQARVLLISDWCADDVHFDIVLHHGDPDQLRKICRQVAQRTGPIITVYGLAPGDTDIPFELLLIERVLSVNTTATGGNTRLMTLD